MKKPVDDFEPLEDDTAVFITEDTVKVFDAELWSQALLQCLLEFDSEEPYVV
jgi:hypothetical protein